MANIVRCNIAIFLLVSLFLSNNVVVLQALHHAPSKIKNQPYRTGFHFQPPKNWMNDPNGPMIYKGVYHLFYQWNPNGAVMKVSEIVWGHATSTDLINWTPHSPAIKPSRPSDINGCWSGSVTILPDGKPVILYTGNDQRNHQVQNLAKPKNLTDPYLRHWTKSPENPLVTPNAVNHINSTAFRDPTTAWLGRNGRWRVVTGSQEGRRGLALLHTSRDFIRWKQSPKPLHYRDGTGMWECPDFFPVSRSNSYGLDTSSFGGPMIKHVLKVSLSDTSHDYYNYTIGTYDHVRDLYVPDDGFVQDETAPRYDYGKFYASKSFYDSVNRRRILWGWVNESSPEKDNIEKGWAGLQAIPRKIWLDESGKRLVQWPVKEIEKLRTTQVKLENKVMRGGGSVMEVHGATASQADVEVMFKVRGLEKADVIQPGWTDPQLICSQKNASSVKSGLGPFGLMVLASKNLEEYTSVYLRIFKTRQNGKEHVVVMCSDQSRSSLEKGNDKTTYGAFVNISPYQPISLRTLIDNSIVESFGGKGKACITSRVYPKLAIGEKTHLFAFNNGSQVVNVVSLSAWSMKSSL